MTPIREAGRSVGARIAPRFNPAYTPRVGKSDPSVGLDRLPSSRTLAMTGRSFPTPCGNAAGGAHRAAGGDGDPVLPHVQVAF
jgi:hypothetical protein